MECGGLRWGWFKTLSWINEDYCIDDPRLVFNQLECNSNKVEGNGKRNLEKEKIFLIVKEITINVKLFVENGFILRTIILKRQKRTQKNMF